MTKTVETFADTDGQDEIIRISDLKKYYLVGKETVRALDGVDVTVKRGHFFLITGRSGSGKSTLLSLLAGLDSPTSGTVELLGKRLDRMSEAKRTLFRRRYIGFVFQSYNLLPQYTTLENVALPLAIRGISERTRNKKAKELLAQVGLADHARHKPTELSGGQQQRVGIARALITSPQIVFADELTGNLDSRTGTEIMLLLRGLFRERGTTFVLVSHDMEMRQYMDVTVELLDGRIIDRKERMDG